MPAVGDLSEAVVEIERHVSAGGWDQPVQLFALVPTAELAGVVSDGSVLSAVAQDELPDGMDDEHLADALARIEWPPAVAGCAVAVERLVLGPRRHEVRMVAGVLRDGERYGAVRLRDHDEDSAVLTGTDLVPTLCDVLALTFVGPGDEEETGS
jgi:hypothetical protein